MIMKLDFKNSRVHLHRHFAGKYNALIYLINFIMIIIMMSKLSLFISILCIVGNNNLTVPLSFYCITIR